MATTAFDVYGTLIDTDSVVSLRTGTSQKILIYGFASRFACAAKEPGTGQKHADPFGHPLASRRPVRGGLAAQI